MGLLTPINLVEGEKWYEACDSHTEVYDVVSEQGNCLFTAISDLMGYDVRARMLLTLPHHRLTQAILRPPRSIKGVKRWKWCDEDDLECVAKNMGVTFCVHVGDVVRRFEHGPTVHHLDFEQEHFRPRRVVRPLTKVHVERTLSSPVAFCTNEQNAMRVKPVPWIDEKYSISNFLEDLASLGLTAVNRRRLRREYKEQPLYYSVGGLAMLEPHMRLRQRGNEFIVATQNRLVTWFKSLGIHESRYSPYVEGTVFMALRVSKREKKFSVLANRSRVLKEYRLLPGKEYAISK